MKKILLSIFLFLFLAYTPTLFAQDKKERVAVGENVLPELVVVDNVLYVRNATIGKKIEIFTIVGNKVREIEVKSTEGEYQLNLPKTIYFARLEGTVRKFVINK